MATRFYLPQSGSLPAGFSAPALMAGWDTTDLSEPHVDLSTKTYLTGTTNSVMDPINNATSSQKYIPFRRYYSDPLIAQTISAQAIKAQIMAIEEAISGNYFFTLSVRAVRLDGGAITGTILAISTGATEIDITNENRAFSGTTSSLAINENDRLEITIGASGNPSTTDIYVAVQTQDAIGNSGDLPENETLSSMDYNPWVEFANNLIFVGSPNANNQPISHATPGLAPVMGV